MTWRKQAGRRIASQGALLVLCLFWALGSLRSDLIPHLSQEDIPQLAKQSIPFAVLAILAAVFAAVRQSQWPRRELLRWSILVGLGMFAVPALLVHFTRGWLSDLTRVALFSLTPVFAVVLEPFFVDDAQQGKGDLLAALSAVAGILLFIPVQAPGSPAAGVAFCAVVLAAACVASANCLAVKTATRMETETLAPMAAIAAGGAALLLILFSALTEQPTWAWNALGPEFAWSAAFDVPGLLLLFWLMRRMSAVRMTARFLLTPWLAGLIALSFLRPSVTLRAGLGLFLIAAGAGWLLFGPNDDAQKNDLQLKLHL
ncbi:MAG TPA: hypothetical protein VMU48_16480 [Terracidiphilus sp.]|nr:hypothetical protein [Terracidiphilus sp.]